MRFRDLHYGKIPHLLPNAWDAGSAIARAHDQRPGPSRHPPGKHGLAAVPRGYRRRGRGGHRGP